LGYYILIIVGDAISAMLINFLNKYWPDLINQGKVYKVLTPLMVAKKKNQTKLFYTFEEFNKWKNTKSSKSWNIEYKKGLASLEDEEYSEIINNPRLIQLENDDLYKKSLTDWFGPNSEPRKEKLLKK